jgi:hypothetical protein
MYQKVDVEIESRAPLYMHNGRLADDFDQYVIDMKNITSKPKKQKTDDDARALMRLEYFGGAYATDNGEGTPYIPSENIERMLRDGATALKNGKKIQAGVLVPKDAPLLYKGPKTMLKLFELREFLSRKRARIGQASVMRTRPIFSRWGLKFQIWYLSEVINLDEVESALVHGGRFKGLGDWRPKHGRFEVAEFQEVPE